VTKKGAQVVGISVDSVESQRKFKEKLKVPYTLLSDAGGKVAAQYGGKVPVLGLANRATFVIHQDGTVKEVVTGGDAIDPGGAIASCPLRKGEG
jgi:peroxiredoxin Q/BCP